MHFGKVVGFHCTSMGSGKRCSTSFCEASMPENSWEDELSVIFRRLKYGIISDMRSFFVLIKIFRTIDNEQKENDHIVTPRSMSSFFLTNSNSRLAQKLGTSKILLKLGMVGRYPIFWTSILRDATICALVQSFYLLFSVQKLWLASVVRQLIGTTAVVKGHWDGFQRLMD